MQAEHHATQSVKNLKKPWFAYTSLWVTLAGLVGGLVLLSVIVAWVVTWLWMEQLAGGVW